MLATGAQALSNLFGSGEAASVLGGALAKFAGAPPSAANAMLSLVAPAVLGSISKLAPENWSSGFAISKLFESQKGAIEAAMPAGLSEALKPTGLLAGVQGLADQGRSAARTAANAASRIETPASSGGGMLKWAIAALILLGLIAWYMSSQTQDVANQAKETASYAMRSAEPLKVGAAEATAALQKTADDVQQSLRGVTDATTARVALPKLQDAAAQFDKIDAVAAQLPATGRSALAALIKTLRPSLDGVFTRALAVPGAADVIKPSIDAINAKLDKLVKDAG
jgi:hypothetical protein